VAVLARRSRIRNNGNIIEYLIVHTAPSLYRKKYDKKILELAIECLIVPVSPVSGAVEGSLA